MGSELAVLQAPMLDGLSFDLFPSFDDGAGPAEVSADGRHAVQALVVAPVVVVLDERLDPGIKVARHGVVLQQGAVLQGPVPAFDLVLGLRAHRGAPNLASVNPPGGKGGAAFSLHADRGYRSSVQESSKRSLQDRSPRDRTGAC